MDKLAELKEKLKELSPEELEEFKVFLTKDGAESEDAQKEEEPAVEPVTKTKEEETGKTPAAGKKTEELEPTVGVPKTEETTGASKKPAEAEETLPAEEDQELEERGENEGAKEETEAETTAEDNDYIAPMAKSEPAGTGEADTVDDASTSAETEETSPTDYAEIVDGLNAKIAALEAENASLKSRVESAFGFSAKPDAPAKVKRLYDDCSDIHFHK